MWHGRDEADVLARISSDMNESSPNLVRNNESIQEVRHRHDGPRIGLTNEHHHGARKPMKQKGAWIPMKLARPG